MSKYRSAWAASPSAMAFLSIPEGRFIEINRSFEDLSGMSKADLLGSSVTDLGIMSDATWDGVVRRLEIDGWVEPRNDSHPDLQDTGLAALRAAYRVEGEEEVLAVFDPIGARFGSFRGVLREREDRFRAIFDQSRQLMALLDPEGRVLEVNETALQVQPTRISRERAIGAPFWNTPWWKGNPRLQEEIRAHTTSAATGRTNYFRAEFPDSAGKRRVFDNLLSPVRDADNRIRYLIVQGWEITELLEARESLAATEERARLLAEHAFEGLVMVNAVDGRILETNRRAQEMVGRTAEEMTGRLPTDFTAPQSLNDVREKISAGFAAPYEAVVFRKDGTALPVEIEGKEVTLQGRRVRISAFRDISWRKEAERRVKESEARYASLVANIPDVTWILRRDGVIDFISPNLTAIFGVSQDQVIGTNLDDWVSGVPLDDRQELLDAVELLFSEGRPFDIEFPYHQANGERRWIQARAIEAYAERGHELAYGVLTDLTEKKSLQQQLLQAQKLEELGTLASGIAHDFNNLLVPILGYADCHASGTPLDDPLMAGLRKHLLDSAHRARDLIRQILAFGRKTETKLRVLDPAQAVNQALRLVSASLPANIRLSMRIATHDARVRADATQIQQVTMNLCTNAIQAMAEDGGELSVELEGVDGPLSASSGNGEASAAGFVLLKVRDTGMGIPEDRLSAIFEPFFTTKDPGQGTGLGLSIVHSIVHSHGGTVEVKSEPGHGTCFFVYLPAIEESQGQEAWTSFEESSAHETVVVVDDQEASLATVGRLLQRLGYRVESFANPSLALELARNKPHSFDLALIDYDMPEMTGTHLAIELLVIRPDLPIVLTTGSDPSKIGDVERLGVMGKIMKPFTVQELGAVVREALEEGGRRSMKPN